jgi:hypothetical protein
MASMMERPTLSLSQYAGRPPPKFAAPKARPMIAAVWALSLEFERSETTERISTHRYELELSTYTRWSPRKRSCLLPSSKDLEK